MKMEIPKHAIPEIVSLARRHDLTTEPRGDEREIVMDVFQARGIVSGERTSLAAHELADMTTGPIGRFIENKIGVAKGTKYEAFERLKVAYSMLESIGFKAE